MKIISQTQNKLVLLDTIKLGKIGGVVFILVGFFMLFQQLSMLISIVFIFLGLFALIISTQRKTIVDKVYKTITIEKKNILKTKTYSYPINDIEQVQLRQIKTGADKFINYQIVLLLKNGTSIALDNPASKRYKSLGTYKDLYEEEKIVIGSSLASFLSVEFKIMEPDGFIPKL